MNFADLFCGFLGLDSESVPQAVLDAMPAAITCWDEDFRLLASNRAAGKMFAPDEEVTAETHFAKFADTQPCGQGAKDMFGEQLERCFAEGLARVELYARPNGGELLCFEITMSRIAVGERRIALCYALDISVAKRNAALTEERELAETHTLIHNAAPMGISLWNSDLKLIDCNEAAYKIFGFESKRQYIDNWSKSFPEYQPDGMLSVEKFAKYMKQSREEGYCRYEWMGHTLAGEPIPVDVVRVKVKYRDSFLLVSYVQDLRPLQAATKEIRDAEEMNNLLLGSAPFSISIWDDKFVPVNCNEHMLRMLGLKSKEEYFAKMGSFSPERQPCGTKSREKFDGMLRQALDKGHSRFEFTALTAQGKLVPNDITMVRFRRQDRDMIACYATDLSEIKKAEQKEREVMTRWQLIHDAAPLGINFRDDKGNIIDCNKEAYKMMGFESKQEYLENWPKSISKYQPDGMLSSDKTAEVLRETVEKGYCRHEWTAMNARTGELVPADVVRLRVDHGDSYIIVTYFLDLRPLRETTQKLQAATDKEQEASALAKVLLDSSPMLVEILDERMNVIDCNRQTLDMFGFSDKREYMKRAGEFLPERQPCGRYSADLDAYYGQKALEEGFVRYEWVRQKPDGELLPSEVVCVRVERSCKTILIKYTHDLREIKNMMRLAAAADARAKTMLDASPVACYLFDSEYRAVELNQAAKELFAKEPGNTAMHKYPGLREECEGLGCKRCMRRGSMNCPLREYILSNHRVIFPDYERNKDEIERGVERHCQNALRDGVFVFEQESATLYGDAVPCEITVIPVEYRGGQGFAWYLRDLRESQKIQAEVRRREAAEEESWAKTRFLARMSHEIRTPMNAVLGTAEIQLQKTGHHPETEEAFQLIYNSSSMLLAIINDILDLSKVEAGKMEIIPSLYDTVGFIVDTVQLNLMNNNRRKIEFALHVDERLPSRLIGDELRIKQILGNLISNAFKHTEKGEIKLSFGVESCPSEDMVMLVLVVADTGIGMDEEQAAQLFEIEFTRFNTGSGRNIEGSGLGMSISHSLIKMMGGEIEVDTKPGRGTKFTVRIPQGTGRAGVLGKDAAERLQDVRTFKKAFKRIVKLSREPMPYGRVLVVDDVESNLYVAKGMLAPYKLDVDMAESGKQAVEKIAAGAVYDIIFMDHMMPGLDGIETTRTIRDMGYKSPIVALTANTMKGQADLFMSFGFDGFISKPIDIARLDACLIQFIRDKQPKKVLIAARAKAISQDAEGMDPRLIESFLRDVTRAIGVLGPFVGAAQLSEDELRSYTIQMHSLKSALANIGRMELSKMSYALENAGREKNMAAIISETPIFLEHLKKVIEEVTPTLAEDICDEDPQFLREQLMVIAGACEDYDIERANRAVSELFAKRCSRPTSELLKKLSALLLHSDFEEAAELAAKASRDVVR